MCVQIRGVPWCVHSTESKVFFDLYNVTACVHINSLLVQCDVPCLLQLFLCSSVDFQAITNTIDSYHYRSGTQ